MAESSRLGIVMGCHQRVRPPSAGISPSSAAGPIPVYGEGFCSGPPEANPYPYPYGYIPEPEAGIPDPCLSLPKTTYIGPNLMTLYLSQLMSVTGKYLESLGVYEPTERTPFTSPDALSLDGAEGGGDADVVKVAVVVAEEVLDAKEVAIVAPPLLVEDVVAEVALLLWLVFVDEEVEVEEPVTRETSDDCVESGAGIATMSNGSATRERNLWRRMSTQFVERYIA